MKTWIVVRTPMGVKLYREENGSSVEVTPARSLELVNHSPDGFELGYAGSGPAQLALAILVDSLDNDFAAVDAYRQFTLKFLAATVRDQHKLEFTQRQILEWFKDFAFKATL